MATHVEGLVVIGELVCDGCGKIMRQPERYAYVYEDGKDTVLRLCENCSRARGYLQQKRDVRGHEIETFI